MATEHTTIRIYTAKGQTRADVGINMGAKGHFMLGAEDYIVLPFHSATAIPFAIGDYVDLRERFKATPENALLENFAKVYRIVDLPSPSYDAETGALRYELRLDAYYMEWRNRIFVYFNADSDGNKTGPAEASWNLTAPLTTHLEVFLRNLKENGYMYYDGEGNMEDFSISTATLTDNTAKLASYTNTNLLDAMNLMAETWECEWWVTGSVIHFGKLEGGEAAVDFSLGENVTAMSRNESKGTFATRLYVYGSTRNLPPNYREVQSADTVNGVVQKRLMLPESLYGLNGGKTYVDAYRYDTRIGSSGGRVYIWDDDNKAAYIAGNPMPASEVVEAVISNDEIYPKTESEVSAVTTRESTDEGTNETETFYRIATEGFTFKEEYLMEGVDLQVKFTSGLLNGMTFGVTFNPDNVDDEESPEAQLLEIVVNEDYGRRLPDAVLSPAVGDKFVLLGWDSTRIEDLGLVDSAEEELLAYGVEYIKKTMVDDGIYATTLMSHWVAEDMVNHGFRAGQKVNIVNPAFFEGSRQSRVVGYDICLDLPFDAPVYHVGESVQYSRIGDIESKVAQMVYNGGSLMQGIGGGIGRGQFLSKLSDDVAKGRITFEQAIRVMGVGRMEGGATFGSYNPGEQGKEPSGAVINGNGTSEFENVTIRQHVGTKDFAEDFVGTGARLWQDKDGKTHLVADHIRARDTFETTTFRFNMVDVISGEQWNTFAFGTVKSVVPGDGGGTLWLDLVDGEMMSVKVGDILRGQFHYYNGTNNTEEGGNDDCGFPKIAGFTTSYFTVTALNETGDGFTYRLREGTTVHPAPGMKFAAYGSFSDESRRSTTYSTRTRLIMLENVADWVIDPNLHYVYVRGDLNGLSYGGMTFSGHGTIQKNSYIYGSQIFFTDAQKEELSSNVYNVILSTYEGLVNTDILGNTQFSESEEVNVITEGSESDDLNVTADGDIHNVITTTPNLSTLIQAFKGTTALTYSNEAGNGTFSASIECVGCTAELSGGLVIVTGITDPDECYITIHVNCEGKTTVTKHFNVVSTENGQTGLQGCTIRTFQNGFEAGKVYVNDELNTDKTTERYVDVCVLEATDSVASGYHVYRVRASKRAFVPLKNYKSQSDIDIDDGLFNESCEEINTQDAAYFNWLIAANASIKILDGAQFTIHDSERNVVGGMQGSREDAPIIWAGGTSGVSDINGAAFRVYGSGKAVMTDAEVEGKVISGNREGQRVELDPENKSVTVYDGANNPVSVLEGNSYTEDSFLSQSGVVFSMNSNATMTEWTTPVQAVAVSSYRTLDSTGVLKVNISNLQARVTLSALATPPSGVLSQAKSQVSLYLRGYRNQGDTEPAYSVLIRSAEAAAIPSTTAVDVTSPEVSGLRFVTFPGKGYHYRLEVVVKKNLSNTISLCEAYGKWHIASATLEQDIYNARLFSNGLALTKNASNHLLCIVDSAGVMNMILGGRFRFNGIPQPQVVFMGQVSYKGIITTMCGKTATCSKTETGIYPITLSNVDGLTSANTFISVTPSGTTVGYNNHTANIAIASNNGASFTIHTRAGSTLANSGFYLEVKRTY